MDRFTILQWMACGMILFAVLGALALPLRGLPSLCNYPMAEDGYLVMSVARHVGMGEGITIDGETATNGFQPLWVFLIAPLFTITGDSRVLGIRLVIFAQACVYALSALLLYLVVSKSFSASRKKFGAVLGVTASAIFVCSYDVWVNAFTGMETGLLFLLYLTVLWVLQNRRRKSIATTVLLGAVAGLLVLTRIDAGFFVVYLGFLLAISDLRRDSWKSSFVSLLVYGGTCLLVTLPWWIFNLVQFHDLMPISGQATTSKVEFFAANIGLASLAVIRSLVPQVPFLRWEPWQAGIAHGSALVGQLIVVGTVCRAHIRHNAPSQNEIKPLITFATALVLSTITLWLWYGTKSWATWFYPRYFSYLGIFGSLLTAAFIVALSRRSLFLAICGLVAIGGFHVRSLTYAFQSLPFEGRLHSGAQLELVDRNVPSSEVVSAGQTGVLGFFRSHVVNFDGKVNSEALAYRGRINDYLEERNIRWVCDTGYVLSFGFAPERNGWTVVAEREHCKLWTQMHSRLLSTNDAAGKSESP